MSRNRRTTTPPLLEQTHTELRAIRGGEEKCRWKIPYTHFLLTALLIDL